jgi:hypothetical protein
MLLERSDTIHNKNAEGELRMKIGIDFHGVITDSPKTFARLSKAIMMDACNIGEVHIMTGSRADHFKTEFEKKKFGGIHMTHFFSISDHIRDNHPDKMTVDDEKNPYVEDKAFWDRQKGDYARRMELDMVIDDNIAYRKYFTTPFSLYVPEKHAIRDMRRKYTLE